MGASVCCFHLTEGWLGRGFGSPALNLTVSRPSDWLSLELGLTFYHSGGCDWEHVRKHSRIVGGTGRRWAREEGVGRWVAGTWPLVEDPT